jgi:hypothetical protein
MNQQGTVNRKVLIMSRVAMLAIFLALIRCISEPLRLQYYSPDTLSVDEVRPFLIGALICALSILAITVLSFFSKHRVIIAIALLTVLGLLWLKWQTGI